MRCRSCGCWLCELCASTDRAGGFCSRRCRTRFAFRAGAIRLVDGLTVPLEPVWTFAVIAAMSALLLAGIGRLVGELVEVSSPPVHAGPEVSKRIHTVGLEESDSGWNIVIMGEPDADVRIFDPVLGERILTLDEAGTGKLQVPPTPPRPAQNARKESRLDPSARPTNSPPPTARPFVSPTAAPTPRPTGTPKRRPPAALVPLPTATLPTIVAATPLPSASPSPTAVLEIPQSQPTIATQPSRRRLARARKPGPPVLHLVTDAGPHLALTFDGGASTHRTAELLDLLQKLDIEATLFLTGQFITNEPGLVRRAVLSGHEVGNHTFTHPHLTTYGSDRNHTTLPGITRAVLVEELKRTEEAFQRATGRPMAPLWRAPFGEENSAIRQWAYEAGYLHVRWSSLEGRSLDTLDWINDEHSSLYRNSQEIVDRLLAFPQLRGGIALMHLSTTRTEAPWLRLPEFIRALQERELEPVKVTTLLEQSKRWKKWLEGAEKRHRERWGN